MKIEMKIRNWDEMTVGAYQELLEIIKDGDAVAVETGIVGLLCGAEERDIDALNLMEYQRLRQQAQFIAEFPKVRPNCPKSIVLNGTKYTITRDVKKMSVGQYVDFQTYSKMEFNEVLVDLISCFIIPQGKEYGEGYDIELVKNDIRDYMSVPMAYGLTAFFFRQLQTLMQATLLFSERTMRRTMRREKDPKRKEELKGMLEAIKAARSKINGDGLNLLQA